MLKIPSTIDSVATTKDKGLKLVVLTQELTQEDKAEIMGLSDMLGYMLFAPQSSDLTEQTIKDLPKLVIEKGEKSPSTILRGRMFVYFTKVKRGEKKDFEKWYQLELDRIGQAYLEKIV